MVFYSAQHGGAGTHAVRGHIVTVKGDPFVEGDDDVLVDIADGLVIVHDGIITAVGQYDEVAPRLTPDIHVDHYPGRLVTAGFVEHYNACRLHSAIGYVTPSDKLAGREAAIFAERDRKLEAARELRRRRRELARQPQTHHHPTETSPPASP